MLENNPVWSSLPPVSLKSKTELMETSKWIKLINYGSNHKDFMKKSQKHLLKGKAVVPLVWLLSDTPKGGTLWFRYSKEFTANTTTPPEEKTQHYHAKSFTGWMLGCWSFHVYWTLTCCSFIFLPNLYMSTKLNKISSI